MTMQAVPTTIDYAAKIRDRIKSALVDIIPDEQWTVMIQGEVDRFMKASTRESRSYYTTTERVPSGLEEVVQSVLREETIKRVKAMLATPEWAGHWDGTQHTVGEKVAAIIRDNSRAIIESWLGEHVQKMLSGIR